MNNKEFSTLSERIISREEFRERSGIGRTKEWQLLRQGKLPAIVIIDGRKLGYAESDFLKWIHKNKNSGGHQ